MDSQLKRGLVEYCVLANLSEGDSYGYEIVKSISRLMPITESTLYPILKRLEQQEKVETYSKEHNGRLRKYYRITRGGRNSIAEFLVSWGEVEKIHQYIKGSVENG